MRTSVTNVIVYLLVALGAIGLVSLLITNPLGLLKTLIITVIFVAVLTWLIQRFIARGRRSSVSSKYRQAVRQSKKRLKEKNLPKASHLKVIRSKQSRRSPLDQFKRRDHQHLTVIEGKKKRRRKRALF